MAATPDTTQTTQTQHEAQIIRAPARPPITGLCSIFLAGTTASPDWRAPLTTSLAHLPLTILNPLRPDWDSSWHEDVTFAPFRQQVAWELDMQELADIVVVYFGPGTDAPVSLLELGLCARSGRALVACHMEYRKRGNVQMVCERLGVELLFVGGEGEEDGDGGGDENAVLAGAVKRRWEGILLTLPVG